MDFILYFPKIGPGFRSVLRSCILPLVTDLPEKSSTQHLQPDKDFPQCWKNLMAPSNKGEKRRHRLCSFKLPFLKRTHMAQHLKSLRWVQTPVYSFGGPNTTTSGSFQQGNQWLWAPQLFNIPTSANANGLRYPLNGRPHNPGGYPKNRFFLIQRAKKQVPSLRDTQIC